MSLREQILAAKDRQTDTVATPEWAPVDSVYIRRLTPRERRELEGRRKALAVVDDGQRGLALICTYVVCDEQAKRVFSDDDVEALEDKDGVVIDRIVSAWVKLQQRHDPTKDAEKNS